MNDVFVPRFLPNINDALYEVYIPPVTEKHVRAILDSVTVPNFIGVSAQLVPRVSDLALRHKQQVHWQRRTFPQAIIPMNSIPNYALFLMQDHLKSFHSDE